MMATDKTSSTCSCGVPVVHVIARRKTADNKTVLGWCDGALTSAMNGYPPGIAFSKHQPVAEARMVRDLVLEEVALYDWSELPALIRAARGAC